MAFGARILADSMSPDNVRLTSFEVTHPRYILAEVNTHRMLSRNSASSRAIPVATLLARLKTDPYVPIFWGKNKKGMQAAEELDEKSKLLCAEEWLKARDDAMTHAEKLRELGLHKQDANRLLEPFMWHTAIITATEWDNFFHLRNHPDAHPAFQTLAAMMQELYEELEPEPLGYGDWHLPLLPHMERLVDANRRAGEVGSFTEAAYDWARWIQLSTGRCARVSMEKHEDDDAAVALRVHDTLLEKGHMSPFEHVARPATREDSSQALVLMENIKSMSVKKGHTYDVERSVPPDKQWHGNFRGWMQYRKTLPWEHDPLNPLNTKAQG